MQVAQEGVTTGQPQLVWVGGFLGAGKTTAIARLSNFLKKIGVSVAVLIPPAATETVDALRLRELGVPLEEYGRGDATKGGRTHIVEVAGDSVAPENAHVSVVVDPSRAAQIFGIEAAENPNDGVAYLYRKQLQQASLLLLNKKAGTAGKRDLAVRRALEAEAPEAHIIETAQGSEGALEEWWQCLNAKLAKPARIETNPETISQARSSIGALNCAVTISTVKYFDGDKVLLELGGLIQNILRQEGSALAHLKMFLKPIDGVVQGFATAHATNGSAPPSLWESLPEPIKVGRMVLSLRALADPEVLHSAANRALLALVERYPELFARLDHSEHFRPGKE